MKIWYLDERLPCKCSFFNDDIAIYLQSSGVARSFILSLAVYPSHSNI